MTFVPLFCESHYSPLGVSSCADLARRARALGYATLGLCDEGTFAGYREFDQECREHGIRPVFGCRLRFDGLVARDEKFPIDFLIETEQGYRNLVRLMPMARGGHGGPGAPRRHALKGRTTGLRVVIPPDGELSELIRRHDRAATEKFLKTAIDTFRRSLVIGLPLSRRDPPSDSMLGRLADFTGAPGPLAPRIQFAEPADLPAYVHLSNPDGPPGRGWKPPENVIDLPLLASEDKFLECVGEAEDPVAATERIARRCNWRPAFNRRIIPTQDLERGFDANSFLFDLVIRGAAERFGEINEELKQRINREFEEVKSRDLATYLLLYRQIVNFLDEQGISRGVGRGSSVASVLSYCLGITRIDPLKYRLSYRPLSVEGEVFPLLRIEVPSTAVSTLLEWMRSTFGEEHLVRIGRRLEIKREQVIDELADWAGMTDEERDLAHKERARVRVGKIAKQLKDTTEERKWRRWRDPALIGEMAARLGRRPRLHAPHPGRWTLSDEPLENLIPIVETDDGVRVTDIDEDAIDRLGAPRIEFVPHHLLNLLDRASQVVAAAVPGFNLQKIPLDDKATFEMIMRGDTTGIPPLEAITVKCLLRKHRPGAILQLLKVKTEAGRGRTAEKTRDLIDELPDVLISYQCAYFKANYPEAYFAGALSSAAEVGDDIGVLVRAVRTAGIEILAPEINLSGANCAVHGGKIRLGLRMVRQLGEKAWEEIASVRRGGRFNTLAELCEGVSSRIINLRVLQNLIGSGAFDSFGHSRAQMSDVVAKLQSKSRSAASGQADESGEQYSLFDMSAVHEEVAAAEEDPEDDVEWDRATTLRREKEALGFNLYADPLERFQETMNALNPLMPDQVYPRLNGKQIRVAGVVDGAESEGPLIEEKGGRLIDLGGLPIWVSAPIVGLGSDELLLGREVLVIGEVSAHHGYTRLEAHGIWSLQDIEDQSQRVDAIQIDVSGTDRATLRRIVTLAKHFRGATVIKPKDSESPNSIARRQLARRRVFFCSPFYQALCQLIPSERIGLLDGEGQSLSIRLSVEQGPPKTGESAAA